MVTTGAICISKVFMGKRSLQVLNMSQNGIDDDGITAIAGALSNSQITELDLSACGITVTKARSLAAGLLVNNSVRMLDVSGNPITVEGARLILQSAVENGICQKVLNVSYGDHEVEMMMSTLKKRKEQVVGR